MKERGMEGERNGERESSFADLLRKGAQPGVEYRRSSIQVFWEGGKHPVVSQGSHHQEARVERQTSGEC